jgi:uncharacterized protein YyaL (SSP411 family)
MKPTHTNSLAREKSPYLLQHAQNPVEWYPWGAEAFEKARHENKPVFLSIGYSTCHWCHVMAHESFEDEATAAIMNREFVNVKVDREERPDVDRVYMTFVQATTGGGGWPMSVWLTPDLKPFVGGTYFPPEDRHGHPGFQKVLERIAAAWKQDPEKISESGSRIIDALAQAQARADDSHRPDASILDAAYQQIARSFDEREGGYGGAPKFPRPVTLNFMFRLYAREGANSETGARALEMNLFTLRKMAAGGIHDHLGGGFHRYSVDGYWHVPHFEKMLYDQAQLAVSYVEAFQITHEPLFETVARDVLDYVRRDMTHRDGGFFSAEDADSLLEHGKPEHAEGAFYVWSEKEIDEALGDAADVFKFHYGVQPHGNAPAGSDPHDEFRGKNILIERHTLGESAERCARSEQDVTDSLLRSRAILFELRAKRPRPHLDDKIITAWNGLMISAFARAAQVLGDRSYAEAATRAARFMHDELYDKERKELARNFREGRSAVAGFADDYAFLIQGLLDLYEATLDVTWLQFANELQETQDGLFWDNDGGGYFAATDSDETILLRMKEDNDGAEPAASSVSALNLLRLAQIRDRAEWRERAEKTIAAFGTQLAHIPSSMPQMLVALDSSLSKPRQIVIAGERQAADTDALLREVHSHFVPNKIVLLADGKDGQRYLEEKLEALRRMPAVGGKATAYVCENFTCQAPVTSPQELRAVLVSAPAI